MKRRFEPKSNKKTKQPKENKVVFMPYLHTDIWQEIAAKLDYPSRGLLRSTSLFFSQDTKISTSYFQDVVRDQFLDYSDDSELADYILAPPDIITYKKLIGVFHSLVEKARLELLQTFESESDIEDSESEAISETERFSDCVKNMMFSACQRGHIAILQMLIKSDVCKIGDFINDKNGHEGMTALGYAAAYGRKRILSLLLENGAQFTVGEIVSWDCQHLIFFDLGYYFKTAVTALHIIALRSGENWLLNILEQFPHLLGSLFTENYKKCLELICKNHPEQLTRLLETDPSLLLEADIAGWGLLHWASCLDKTECMKILIQNGVDVDVDAGDIPPLYLACSSGKLSAIKTLISHNAPIEAFSMNQSTCLHLTANNGHADCTQYLIDECKLDVNATNDGDDTPLSLAKLEINSDDIELSTLEKAKKSECAQLLITRGAIISNIDSMKNQAS